MQSAINEHDREYTPDLIEEGLREAGLDSAMFWEDRHSTYVKSGYEKDLAAATRMGVEIAPSMVLFDYSKDIDRSGVAVAGAFFWAFSISSSCLSRIHCRATIMIPTAATATLGSFM